MMRSVGFLSEKTILKHFSRGAWMRSRDDDKPRAKKKKVGLDKEPLTIGSRIPLLDSKEDLLSFVNDFSAAEVEAAIVRFDEATQDGVPASPLMIIGFSTWAQGVAQMRDSRDEEVDEARMNVARKIRLRFATNPTFEVGAYLALRLWFNLDFCGREMADDLRQRIIATVVDSFRGEVGADIGETGGGSEGADDDISLDGAKAVAPVLNKTKLVLCLKEIEADVDAEMTAERAAGEDKDDMAKVG